MTDPDTEQEQNALRYHSKTFYLASLFLGKHTARQVSRLYAFCRAVDDLADKETDKAKALSTLQQWHAEIQSRSSSIPCVRDILHLAQEKQLNLRDIAFLIEGVLSDLNGVHLADEAELTRYCFLVAGTVGLLMSQLLECTEPVAKKFAIDLGIAMQLTNILRDVAEDAAAGRQYIPQAWLPGGFDYLQAAAESSALIKPALNKLFWLAEQYYQSGFAGLRYLPLRHQFCVGLAAKLYQEIGRKAKRKQFNVWNQRIVVTNSRKLCLIGVTAVQLVHSLCSRKKTIGHNDTLHHALSAWINGL